MLDFLEKMVAEGAYQKCLNAAEQLIRSGHNSVAELAQINLIIARCRMWVRYYIGAVRAAQLGLKIARDQSLTALVSQGSWILAAAYYYTRQYDNVISTGYEFYGLVPPSAQSPEAEGKICNLIGLSQYRQNRFGDAYKSFIRAAAAFRQTSDGEALLRSVIWVIRCAHSLGDNSRARTGLKESMQIARTLPKDNWVHQDILVLRSENAFLLGRPDRAAYLALRALALDGAPEPKIRALMLLHRYHLNRSEYKDALGYALAARVTALDARWFHLEYEAAEAMVETIRAASLEDVSALDQEYLSTGVDISRYLPDSVLRHRT